MNESNAPHPFHAALVVAHPDDETIWAGGTVLMNAQWQWDIVCLCRGNDRDRAPRFYQVLSRYGARGAMGDLDDGPDQLPLSNELVQKTILSLLAGTSYDRILTHSPFGEYTRHRRHEETGEAVAALWEAGHLQSGELWMFAYRDSGTGGIEDLPYPIANAHHLIPLPEEIWGTKYRIITENYGFEINSYESATAQREEAFWCFRSPAEYNEWLKQRRQP